MSLSIENRLRVQSAVDAAGDELKGNLPPLPDHPVRNSWAHIWREIKQHFGHSYMKCDDDEVEIILDIVEECRINPR